jgi:hypothetical protein
MMGLLDGPITQKIKKPKMMTNSFGNKSFMHSMRRLGPHL